MRFEEAYSGWEGGRLRQEEAARLLGICERTFRRYVERYEDRGIEGLIDKRLGQVSGRRAPVDEVLAVTEKYRRRHLGWNAKHFYAWYQRAGGKRSYTWVKRCLQEADLIERAKKRGAHRRRRERAALKGMMLHQDGSRHEWVSGQLWDLIVTMDDADSEHYHMGFVEEEGTRSSFEGVQVVVRKQGIFSSIYTDRGSHYWLTPEVGGKVDKERPTQFGRAMQQLGIEMIAAYSPQARGRSERAFRTHQDRLVRELAAAGITEMAAANRYLMEEYLPAFNQEFMEPAREAGSAFVPLGTIDLKEILCEHFERTVRNDNCISLDGLVLQIPQQRHRCHFVRTKVRVHRYLDDTLGVFYGPRCLARYSATGQLLEAPEPVRRPPSADGAALLSPLRATPSGATAANIP
jgi:transposase